MLKRVNLIILFIVCLSSFLLVFPTINNNIDNPNLIAYFNHDEGDFMDLIWYYYSGEKRDSYQLDIDYGLEMIYLSDIARFLSRRHKAGSQLSAKAAPALNSGVVQPSRFTNFTPGTFVLWLRWIHLVSWIGALIALWYLVGYHFGKGRQQILAVLLLASRPAFAYFANNLKPEPLVLLFMIIGMHFVLKIIDKPCRKFLFYAVLCAAVAFLIKFAGIFLLPAVVVGMYFGQRYQSSVKNDFMPVFSNFKNSWTLELLTGVCLIALPFLYILIYVRKSTGFTYYQDFGLLGSFLKHKIAFFVCLAGATSILISLVMFILNKNKSFSTPKIIRKINEINSYAFIVSGIFLSFLLLFGIRWAFQRENFLITYSFNLFDFLGMFATTGKSVSNLFVAYLQSFINKLIALDLIIFPFFGFYLIAEACFYAQYPVNEKPMFYKRLTLLIMLAPAVASLFTMGNFQQHHMLPFFVAMCILGIQGLYLFITYFSGSGFFKKAVTILFIVFFVFDIALNATEMIQSRMYYFRQHEDMVFKVERWLHQNVPLQTKIVADHYIRVYIPPEYRNIKTLDHSGGNRISQLRQLIDSYHPDLVYYNQEPSGAEPFPPLEEILPDKKFELIASFDNKNRYLQREKGNKLVIYKVIY